MPSSSTAVAIWAPSCKHLHQEAAAFGNSGRQAHTWKLCKRLRFTTDTVDKLLEVSGFGEIPGKSFCRE